MRRETADKLAEYVWEGGSLVVTADVLKSLSPGGVLGVSVAAATGPCVAVPADTSVAIQTSAGILRQYRYQYLYW